PPWPPLPKSTQPEGAATEGRPYNDIMEDNSTRDRVRALVREVLAKAAPETAEVNPQPQSRFVNTVQEPGTPSAVTRDESAKSVITEDDVRGLQAGEVLRIGEDARLTP